MITHETLRGLLDLARITIPEERHDRMIYDLQNILQYFEDLKTVSIDSIYPRAGGVLHENQFREDMDTMHILGAHARNAFPKTQEGFLEVPGVFE